jgi:hypothetical protein
MVVWSLACSLKLEEARKQMLAQATQPDTTEPSSEDSKKDNKK